MWAVQAINELHEDEDFQQDAGQSHILGVVDEIRSNSAALAKHEKDAGVMHVLQKLRRFQVCTLRCPALLACRAAWSPMAG